MNEINLPKKYINDEITEYIINTHGIDTLNRIISGEILINDRNLNKLIGNPRTFKINVGINGAYMEFDNTGKAVKIERISKREH